MKKQINIKLDFPVLLLAKINNWYRWHRFVTGALLSMLLLTCLGAAAQEDCETGFCPPSVTVHHYAGAVSPVDVTITYEVVESNLSGNTKCWITRNLGATEAPTSAVVNSTAQSGWYWQFNRKQGYYHDGATRTPNTTWVTISEISSWTAANDPCRLLLGTGWNIPTSAQWINVRDINSWSDVYDSFPSELKIHTGHGTVLETGALTGRGNFGQYWSSSSVDATRAYRLNTYTNLMNVDVMNKYYGLALRCVRDY